MRTLLCLASTVCLLGCLGDDIPTGRTGSPLEAGVTFIDAGDEDDGSSGPTSACPSSEPTATSCTGVSESESCEYQVNECISSDGRTLVDTLVYCCPNGVWGVCGGRSPCEEDQARDASVAPEVDAAPGQRDAAGDANGDGGLDGGIDTTQP
jgi:hypothetical protein